MAFPFSRGGRSQRAAGGRPRFTRPELERLEDRAVPSAGYRQTNLVGYKLGMAPHTDPNLNGWGLAFAPDGHFWVSNTSTGVSTLYDHNGKPLPLVVTIPPAPGHPLGPTGSPTGIVYNPTSDFVISKNGKSAPALFLFDTGDGTISGWNPKVDPNNAVIMVDNSKEAIPASYDGLALGKNSKGQNVLYAADGGLVPDVHNNNNRIDMFDGRFRSLGSFTDPSVSTQYPGNFIYQVQNVGGKLYVTFDGFNAPFGGVVDVFDTDGRLLTPKHFAANDPGKGPLANPWGIAQAPDDFGEFSHDILIGNVEDGRINAFNPVTHKFVGTLRHPDGKPIEIPGLWALAFGADSPNNGETNQLFFTAGPNATDFAGNGLFGMITAAGDGEHEHGPHWGPVSPRMESVGAPSGGAAALLASFPPDYGGNPTAPPATSPTGLPALPSQTVPPVGSGGGPGLLTAPAFAGIFSNPSGSDRRPTDTARLSARNRGILADVPDQLFAHLDSALFSDVCSNDLTLAHRAYAR